MPYEEGLAHYEIGRHFPVSDPARQEHLARAAKASSKMGAAGDLARVKTLDQIWSER